MRFSYCLLLAFCCLEFSLVALPKNKGRTAPSTNSQRGSKSFTSNGFKTYGAKQVDGISEAGSIQLKGTQVAGPVQVNGRLITDSAAMNDLNVRGQATIVNSVVKGKTVIQGTLSSHGSTFEGDIVLHAPKATFIASHVESILVKPDQWGTTPQVIELLNGSTVKGSIIFVAGKGEVITMPDTEMGPIQGGTIKVYRNK